MNIKHLANSCHSTISIPTVYITLYYISLLDYKLQEVLLIFVFFKVFDEETKNKIKKIRFIQ